MILPEPRLPLRTEPWPVGANHAACPVCSLPWRPFAGSRLPCHARCLFDDRAREVLKEVASSGSYRTQGDLASDLGVSVDVLRVVLERGQWSRHTPGDPDPAVPEYALTLHQPWLDAILEHGKPVENRSWPPPRKLVGKLLALHAGVVYDTEAALWIEGRFGVALKPSESEQGAILGVARVVRAFQVDGERRQVLSRLGEQPDPHAGSPWAFGPWCWVLEDLVRVVPVPCRGAQRVWLLRKSTRAELAAALDEQR